MHLYQTSMTLAGASPLAAGAGPGAGAAGGDTRVPRQTLPSKSVPITVWPRNITDQAVFDQITPLVEQRQPQLNVTVEVAPGRRLAPTTTHADSPPILLLPGNSTCPPPEMTSWFRLS